MNKTVAIILIVVLISNLVLRGLRLISDMLFWILILLCGLIAYEQKIRTWLQVKFT